MVNSSSMKLKDLVKTALAKNGMNQTDLAERINVTPAQISRIISGERGTTIEMLVKIADTLGIRHDDIFRAAVNLYVPEEKGPDKWVEKMNATLNGIKDPASRALAERVLESLISGPSEVAVRPSTKKAKGNI